MKTRNRFYTTCMLTVLGMFLLSACGGGGNSSSGGVSVRDGLWGNAQLIETDDTGDANSPQIVFDTNGNALAVWPQGDGTRNNIWANRYAAGSWGNAELIESDTGDTFDPQIAIDPAGNALAVWQQFDSMRNNIQANRFE